MVVVRYLISKISNSLRNTKIHHRSHKFQILAIPCGGGVEYLHRSPAIRRRRRKWNPVPEGITGPPCPWGYKYRDLALQVGGVSNLRE
jgi:hypothetical protein